MVSEMMEEVKHHYGWQCGSVVRTLVFGWRTFPDLWLTYDIG